MKQEHCARCGSTNYSPGYCWQQRRNETVCNACASIIDLNGACDPSLPDDRLPNEVREDERELLLALLRAAREWREVLGSREAFRREQLLLQSVRACEGIGA